MISEDLGEDGQSDLKISRLISRFIDCIRIKNENSSTRFIILNTLPFNIIAANLKKTFLVTFAKEHEGRSSPPLLSLRDYLKQIEYVKVSRINGRI